jgi:transmembrane sensor
VRGEAHKLEVALLEGQVLLSPPRGIDAPSADLTAGNVAIATASDTAITKRPLARLRDQLSWRDGVLVFHHTTLKAACAEFNRYNTQKLVVSDAKAASLTIDGKFAARDIEAFTETAEDVLRLHVARANGQTILSR